MRHGEIARASWHIAVLAAIWFVAGMGSARAQNSSEGRGPNASVDGDSSIRSSPVPPAAASSVPS